MGKRVKPKNKIVLNPDGEFDYVADNNFSYESVPTPKKLQIPENHQMVVHELFEVEQDAELRVDGSLIMEE